jgi:nucleoid-associated protein YgaU
MRGETAQPVRLVISELDGEGSAPELEATPVEGRLAPLRGREFLVLVESQGRVISVGPFGAPDTLQDKSESADDARKATTELEALRELRFRPGDRPRRLLVRVE